MEREMTHLNRKGDIKKTKLTPKQQRFVEEYVIDHNATAAARRAGYSEKTAGVIGHQNLQRPEIIEEINALDQKQAEECGISAKKTKMEIARIAYADMQERAADQIPYRAKMAALRMAGQVDGLFVDRMEVDDKTIEINVTLTDD